MLCAAKHLNACGIHPTPIGYFPCGEHLPRRLCRKCTVKSCIAPPAVSIRSLLSLAPEDDALMMDERVHQLTNDTRKLKCNGDRIWYTSDASCRPCGPTLRVPYECMATAIAQGRRAHVPYAWALWAHLKSNKRPHLPSCPQMALRVSADVDAYARGLMKTLGLVPGGFVVAQYRAGWSWRSHTIYNSNAPWSCYGPGSIRAWLLRRFSATLKGESRLPADLPVLVLSNVAAKLLRGDAQWTSWANIRVVEHEPQIAIPIQILSEMRIAALGHTLLLNPASSFREGITSLRQADRAEAEAKCTLAGGRNCRVRDRVYYMEQKYVLPGDHCGCDSSDEERAPGVALAAALIKARGDVRYLCGNSTVALEACSWSGPRTAKNRTFICSV